MIGSGEHEARHAMLGATIKNVIYEMKYGQETMTLVFDDFYVELQPVVDYPPNESARDPGAHLKHTLKRPDEPVCGNLKAAQHLAWLESDAPYVVCTHCERKSWTHMPGDKCGMTQPDETTCQGEFR